MATKAEMVTFILDNSEEYIQPYLESLSYNKIKIIFRETETLPTGDKIGDDVLINVDDFIQDAEDLDILKEIIEEEDKEVWCYEDLSPNDQRLYRRTGIKRISKSNKYNRFDEEKPKI